MITETEFYSPHFKHFYADFLKTLGENDFTTFGKCVCDESRMQYVFNIPIVHSYKILLGANKKSIDLAKQFKNDGNKAFQEEKFKSALDLYSESIKQQPQRSSSKRL